MPRMPYRPRTLRKKTYRKPVSNRRIAAIAKRTMLRSAETKKHQVELIEYPLNGLAAVANQSICQISQGTGYAQRVGHQISTSGFAIQGQIRNNNYSTGAAPSIVRLMVLRFKNNQANPSADLLENDANNQPVSPDDLRSLYRRINIDSYEVLASRFITVGGLDTNIGATKVFKMWIPYKKNLRYDSTATVDPNFNKVHVVAFARDTGNDNVAPNIEFSFCSTMYYKDM